MKSKGKLYLVLIALCITVATFFTGMTLIASAEEEVTPSLYIERFNLSLRDSVAIKYAVRTENLSSEEKMLIWSQDDVAEFDSQDDYLLGTQSRILTAVGYQLIDEVKYDIFDLTDVAAKQMTEVFYARAYVEQGGNVYYSDVAKYSVAQYAHDLKASGCTDTDLLALVDGMLEYGALAQTYFKYNTDWLATDEAYFVLVEGGTLSDGTTSGFYKSGTILTATPNASEEGKVFSHWQNSAGEELAELTVTKDDTFTAVYNDKFSQGLEYTLNTEETGYIVSMGTCTDADIVIPATYNGLPVTAIMSFAECATLKSISIPAGVTQICNGAFENCTSLAAITFGADSRLEIIGDGAFYGTSLESIAIPAGVTAICDGAFSETYFLESVTFAEGSRLEAIGAFSFQGGYSLTSFDIPAGVTEINQGAFCGCSSITSLTIPAGVTEINAGAFSDMSSLESVTFGEDSTLETIGYGAFGNCTSLNSISIPAGVTTIDKYAFYACPALSSIEIPDGVTSIGDNAFYGCTSLASIKIPDSVTTLGKGAFYNCTSLASIDMSEGITVINDYTFAKCILLADVTLPQNLTAIGDYAFAKCVALENVTIPQSVTAIGDYAFLGCSSLATVYYGGTAADWNNGEKITIGTDAIPATATVYYYSASTPTATGNYWYYDENGNIAIWHMLAYSLNEDNSSYTVTGKFNITDTDIVIPATFNGLPVTAIGNEAFSSTAITSISIPDSVTTLGDGAFSNCASLISVTIGADSNLVTIGEGAFYNCTSLTSIFIPKSVTIIEDNALYNCTSLTALYYGATVAEWDNIEIVGDNYGLNGNDNLTIYYYCESTPAAEGNYWRYVDGVPAKW